MVKRPNKGPAPPKELFTIGSKGKVDAEIKATLAFKKAPGSTYVTTGSNVNITAPSQKRERDQSTELGSSLVPPSKRSRHGSGMQISGKPSDMHMHAYEYIAIDTESIKFVESVMNSLNDFERIEGLLCGAVKNLNKMKPDAVLYQAIMFLAKSKPELFQSEIVVEAFCSLLKKDVNNISKTWTNSLVPILVCNVLLIIMQEETSWPDSFVRVYLDDSLGERVWVDRIECRTFVKNVVTAFGTKLPSNIFQVDLTSKSETSRKENEELVNSIIKETSTEVMQRYSCQMSSIEMYVIEIIKDHSYFQQPSDRSIINMVRTLAFLCGIYEIRTIVVQKLDMWLQTPKLMKASQDLLMVLCMNVNPKKNPQDLELINKLCKIRFKTKQLSLYFNTCIKELLVQNSENISFLLQNIVLQNNDNNCARNLNYVNIMNVMIQYSGEHTVQKLAEVVLKNLVVQDSLKATWLFLREVMRCSNVDFKFDTFIFSLLQDKNHTRLRDLDTDVKERYISGLADIISMTMLCSVYNFVRETSSKSRTSAEYMEALRELKNQISLKQRDVVWWLHSFVKITQMKSSDYMLFLKKVLFIDKYEIYSMINNLLPDGELLKLVSEVPAQEDMLLCIVLMGNDKELNLDIHALVDILESVIMRAASIFALGFPTLKVDNIDFMGALLNLCAYSQPMPDFVPKGNKPSSLAITTLYWKALQILLIISAFNPMSIGLKAWNCYPTLKCLMEIVMTKNFCFPRMTMAPAQVTTEEIKSPMKELVEHFKHQTIEFEDRIANETISDGTSLQLPQNCQMEELMLELPQSVLDSIRNIDQSLSLGKLLCQSREPADFLLHIIQRQGASQSMPWLKDLIESDESFFEELPVQCLCEILLHDIQNDTEVSREIVENRQLKHLKKEQLLMRLQVLVRSMSNEQKVIELLKQTVFYFFERLSSNRSWNRRQATNCLALILGQSSLEGDEKLKSKNECSSILNSHGWLFEELPSLIHFEAIKMQIFTYLVAACQVETNFVAVSTYLVFLSQHSTNLVFKELDDLVLDVAQLILERIPLVNYLLPYDDVKSCDPLRNLVLSSLIDLFYCHLSKALQPVIDTRSWSNNQCQILLHRNTSQSAKMDILIFHASVIILTHGPPKGKSRFNELMDMWFPQNESQPSAYLVDTSEEALLIPEWLKLRMISSNVPRLIDASFADAKVSQLLLFIQSFGISVYSMSKLLHHLDMSIETNQTDVMRLVLDKNYMAELIEVQHMRGAKGGTSFYNMLTGGQKQLKNKSENCVMQPFIIESLPIKQEDPVKYEQPEIVLMLTKVFLDSSTSRTEKCDTVRFLQKVARTQAGTVDLLESCNKIINSVNGNFFVESLSKHPAHSCPLFTSMFFKCQINSAEGICDTILSRSKNQTGLFFHLLKDFLKKSNVPSRLKINNEPMEITKEEQDLKKEEVTEECALQILEGAVSQPSKMEEVIASTFIPFLKQVNNSSNILKILNHLYKATCSRLSYGFFLDYFELFYQQIVQHDMLEQILEIVFRRESNIKSENDEILAPTSPACEYDDDIEGMKEGVRPVIESFYSQNEYLLCLLLHRTGWSNIIRVVNHLLPKFARDYSDKYDYSVVLDFVEACFNVPRLWQGIEKTARKHQPLEDILSLNLNQIHRLVSMAVKEQVKRQSMKLSMDKNKVTYRLNLIESCCNGKIDKLIVAVNVLLNFQKTEESSCDVASVFLWGLYLRSPHVFTKLTQKMFMNDHAIERLFTEPSHLDIATQRVITCLIDVNLSGGSLDEYKLLHSTNVSRKLASQHPLIFLRQLPLLASFLEGQAQLLCGERKTTSEPRVITNILGIVHLLQPHIFHPFHSRAFHNIINSYCQIVSSGFFSRYPNGLTKFIEMVLNYFHHNPKQACICLRKHLSLLMRLDDQHGGLLTFQRLLLRLSCIDDLRHKTLSNFMRNERNSQLISPINKSSELFSFTFGTVKCLTFSLPAMTNPVFFTLSQKTNRFYVQTTTELMEGLKELDDISKNVVDVLEEFTDNIEKLMLDISGDCREVGYTLMMRLLRCNPRKGKFFVNNMKKCLESENFQIVQTSLSVLKEFAVLTQEHAGELLVAAFKAGLALSLDVTPYINETLQILNLRLTSH